LTVKFFLPPAVSVAHSGLAEAFFCMTLALAVMTSPKWLGEPTVSPHARSVQRFAMATTGLVYLQLLLGATVRHGEHALFAHILGAIVVLLSAWTAGVVAYTVAKRRDIVGPAVALGALVFVQLWIGIVTLVVRVPKADHGQLDPAQIWWPTAHLAVGALILAVSFVLALRAGRHLRMAATVPEKPATGPAGEPITGVSAYLELTKPRIVSMVLVTTTLGFFLGDTASIPWRPCCSRCGVWVWPRAGRRS